MGQSEDKIKTALVYVQQSVFFSLALLVLVFNLYAFNSGRVVLQKHQVIVPSLGCCCRQGGEPPESRLLEFLQRARKDGGR